VSWFYPRVVGSGVSRFKRNVSVLAVVFLGEIPGRNYVVVCSASEDQGVDGAGLHRNPTALPVVYGVSTRDRFIFLYLQFAMLRGELHSAKSVNRGL
jgi:hypothetical protein